ncbi:MAG: hypothetical protein AAFO69_15160 [Bacteroidota bacterium]
MKRIIRLIAVLVIVMNAASIVRANDLLSEGEELKVIPRRNQIYKLVYKAEEQQRVVLKLMDDQNQVLYLEHLTVKGTFVKAFDLSNMPTGHYHVELTAGEDTLKRDIAYFSAHELYGDYVQVKPMGGEQFRVLLGETVNEALDLYIKDAAGELLYYGNVSQDKRLVYDLKQLYGDSATFLFYLNDDLVKEQQVSL